VPRVGSSLGTTFDCHYTLSSSALPNSSLANAFADLRVHVEDPTPSILRVQVRTVNLYKSRSIVRICYDGLQM
jgi:hypothetical protein